MKYIKLFESFNYLNLLRPYLIDSKYLYHYTLTDNLDSILEEGLIPRKYPNSFYEKGANGIFLTNKDSLYKTNLPESLMDIISDYYDNEDMYDEKPIVRLWVDVTKLDLTLFTIDDDYSLNRYGYNKAKTDIEKIIESLDIWGSIAYLGIIPKEAIEKTDFDYYV